jgi:hypothetical protein
LQTWTATCRAHVVLEIAVTRVSAFKFLLLACMCESGRQSSMTHTRTHAHGKLNVNLAFQHSSLAVLLLQY